MANPLFISASLPAFNLDGVIEGAATIAFYDTGTLDLADIYDADGDPLENPVDADENARFPSIYLDENIAAYRYIIRDIDGSTIDDVDPYINPYGPIKELIADLAADDGSSMIGYNIGATGAVTRTVQEKLSDYINVKDFGAVGDGVTDDSAAVIAAVAYAASFNVVVEGFKSSMPSIYFPRGRFIITVAGALTGAFSTGIWMGVSFIGDGRGQTYVIYSSTSNASNNYLANFENCSFVTLADMTLKSTDSDLRGILWGPNGGGSGNGSGWHARNVSFEGTWTEVFTVQGTALGSETYWENCTGGAGYSGGSFFYIKDTNKQSVNHTFVQCTIGGLGTTFKIRAGGLIRFIGGYSSIFEGGTFIDMDGPGEKIGINTKLVFYGPNFETAGPIVNAVLVRNTSAGNVIFKDVGFQAFLPSGGNPGIIMGNVAQQRGGRLIFDNCAYPSIIDTELNGGVEVRYIRCTGMGRDWSEYLTLNVATGSNFLTPIVELQDCNADPSAYPTQPIDCYPRAFINEYAVFNSAGLQNSGINEKTWVARTGNDARGAGLKTGLGGTYSYFSVKLPLGAILTSVKFYYWGTGNPGITTDRFFKVTNYDASVDFITEQTVPYNDSYFEGNNDVFWFAPNEETREIRIYGKTSSGSAPSTTEDFGFVVLKYF